MQPIDWMTNPFETLHLTYVVTSFRFLWGGVGKPKEDEFEGEKV